MPQVSLIETSEVPPSHSHNRARVQVAEDTLRRAIQQNKTVRVVLDPDERASGVVNAYRAAAVRIGIGLIVTGGSRRIYSNSRGGEAREASTLYFTITKKAPAAAGAATNGHVRTPVTPGEPQRTFAHGVEITR